MASLNKLGLRDSTGEYGGSFATYVDTLDENKKGNLDPSNQKHATLLNTVITAIQSGQLDDARVQKLMRMNPKAAPVFAAASDVQRSSPEYQRRQILSQHFSPGQEAVPDQTGYVNIPGGVMDQQIEGRQAIAPKADIQGAVLSALNKGDVELAKNLGFAKGGDSPYAKIDPKDYTAESLSTYAKTSNVADLIPRGKPEDADREANRQFNREDKLRDEFRGLSKDFIQVRDSYARINESAKNPSAAGDLALIFNYMKMLDPGSTVREGEFATAQNSAGVSERVRAMYNKAITGERLTDSTRNDFTSRSSALYKRQLQTHKKNASEYTALARRYGLNPNKVITNFELDDMPEADQRPATAPPAGVNQQTGWTPQKESRYQELLRKRNGS